METENDLDEALIPLHEHVIAHTSVFADIVDETNGIKMMVSEIGIETPIELQILTNENGQLMIGTAPPLYLEETTIMPVFHNLKFTAIRNEIKK